MEIKLGRGRASMAGFSGLCFKCPGMGGTLFSTVCWVTKSVGNGEVMEKIPTLDRRPCQRLSSVGTDLYIENG